MSDATNDQGPELGGITEEREARLYGRAELDAAVAAERERWRILLSRQHVFNGSCPDAKNWHDRDPRCPACRALGEWQA